MFHSILEILALISTISSLTVAAVDYNRYICINIRCLKHLQICFRHDTHIHELEISVDSDEADTHHQQVSLSSTDGTAAPHRPFVVRHILPVAAAVDQEMVSTPDRDHHIQSVSISTTSSRDSDMRLGSLDGDGDADVVAPEQAEVG